MDTDEKIKIFLVTVSHGYMLASALFIAPKMFMNS